MFDCHECGVKLAPNATMECIPQFAADMRNLETKLLTGRE
jgi:hypothetical protein